MTLTESRAHDIHDGRGQSYRYDAALEILHHWHHDCGIRLTRDHVERVAQATGAQVDRLWDLILTPPARRTVRLPRVHAA